MSPRAQWPAVPVEARAGFVVDAVLADPLARAVLERAQALALPDWALMAGAVYQAVWNRLAGRPPGYGIHDYDLAYFDDSDLSAGAEAAVIDAAEAAFADLSAPVEIRNQARVHLWFNAKFGTRRAPLRDTEDALRHFASRTHAVAIRLDRVGQPELLAPFGLEPVFTRTIQPASDLAHPEGWNQKIARQSRLWPELEFVPVLV